jgi:hypothetical protein
VKWPNLVALLCLMVGPGATPAFGQDSPVHATKTKASYFVSGSKYCINCHSRADQRNDLCRMIEGYIWDNCDSHKIAADWGRSNDAQTFGGFRSAAGQRAAQIGARLGIKDVTQAMECVGCHSIAMTRTTPKQDFANPLAEGVTCVACHGPYKQWITAHQLGDDPEWRNLTRRQKWVDYGMIDLWNPVVRAQTCISCHVGDADPRAGKTITHAMYASGHPPLPSIEVAAFCTEEPKHWLDLRCKSEAARNRLEFNPARMEQTELVAVSSLVSFSRMMALFEAQAKEQSSQPAWPEFARFDCTACHHDLKSGASRSSRHARARGSSGRPTAPRWMSALIRLGVDAADPARFESRVVQLDERLASFHAAIAEKPFGDPARTAAAARAIIDWIETPLAELSRLASVKRGEKARVLDRSEAVRLLQRLGELTTADLADYESARQIGWAFRTICNELLDSPLSPPGGEPGPNALRAHKNEIQKILQNLDTALILSLRGQGAETFGGCLPSDQVMSIPRAPTQKSIVGAILDARLKTLADYDPDSIARRFADLVQLLAVFQSR